MRTAYTFTSKSITVFKQQLLLWAQQFEELVWLDSNNYGDNYTSYDAVLAAEAFTSITTDYYNAFADLKAYQTATADWLFGYLTYDLKNDVEQLHSNNSDGLCFPDLCFFQPKRLFLIKGSSVTVQYLNVVENELQNDLKCIQNYNLETAVKRESFASPKIKARITKQEYLERVEKVLSHIYRGDIYEANFCQEFYAQNAQIHPLQVYTKLNQISTPPFAAYLKIGDNYALSASPERYLKKDGAKIITQPIKGTAKRSENKTEDHFLKSNLQKDSKERSENIMIVDLVRNDLSKTATKGSVKVEELCKVYSFKQVHQMISTVTAIVEKETHPVDSIKTTFPMGSMTGAPKLSAMQIIERLEVTKRGLYSGAAGYFTPSGNFDFNVIIRSILYNKKKQYVSYSVGSAITAKSKPEKEYEECLVKAKAMRQVLEE